MSTIIFKTPFSTKVKELIESDPDAKGDVASLGVRDAVMECLQHLGAVAVKLLEANATRAPDDPLKGDVFFTTTNILVQVNQLMLLLGHVAPQTRHWWLVEAALLSQLELSLMTICKFAPAEATEECCNEKQEDSQVEETKM